LFNSSNQPESTDTLTVTFVKSFIDHAALSEKAGKQSTSAEQFVGAGRQKLLASFRRRSPRFLFLELVQRAADTLHGGTFISRRGGA
jgi:hypothetical protein